MITLKVPKGAWLNVTAATGLKIAVLTPASRAGLEASIAFIEPSTLVRGYALKNAKTKCGDGSGNLYVRAVKRDTLLNVYTVDETTAQLTADLPTISDQAVVLPNLIRDNNAVAAIGDSFTAMMYDNSTALVQHWCAYSYLTHAIMEAGGSMRLVGMFAAGGRGLLTATKPTFDEQLTEALIS